MQLRIGIISDLHCHNKLKCGRQDSYILTDENAPLFQDPFKSFVKLISEKQLEADILIMPGDFGNRCDREGIAYGWDITKSIGKLLKVKDIIPNVGNHDVDSRKQQSDDPFDFIKNFSTDFPFADQDKNSFYRENGYLILEEADYRILVINSVHSHINADEAQHGLISQEAINDLEERYEKFHDSKLNIAMVHHNPIEHSHFNTGSKDFMYNGDELITILDRFNFDLIIHGHKHDPRVRYSQGGGNSPVIFSAGSFSAYSTLLLQGGHNTFHIMTIEVNEHHVARGIIETWFFIPTKGWKQEVNSNFIDSKIGFGAVVDLKVLSNQIAQWFEANPKTIIEWEDFIESFPDLQYIIPSDFEKLKKDLKSKHILISGKVPNEPTFVQFKA